MVKLELDNVYVKITGLTKEQEYTLWSRLAFRVEVFGVQEVRYRHLFNRKTKKTYAGLTPNAIEILKEYGIPYKLIDKRVKPESNEKYELVKEINGNTVELRPYQQEIVNKCSERETIQAATGAGKTVIMAALIAKYKVSPTCVFADKISLCTQLKSEFEKFLGREIGFIGDGIYNPKDITVMSIQSADEELCKQAKMILVDECLPANAKISMSDGSTETIGNIVKNKLKANVITFNTKTNSLEDCKIINFMERPIGERSIYLLSIKTSNQTFNLTCTNNHKIWVEESQSYVRAEQIEKNMHVVCYNNLDTIEGKIITAAKVASKIEYVYDITVEKNHNFFANGVLVSNCHHVAADTCLKTACKCTNAYYRIGVSATPWRDAGDDMLIEAVLNKRNPDQSITASKLIQLGYLVKPTIYFVPVKGRFQGKQYQQLYDKAIVDNNYRNKIICKIAYQLYKRNRIILLLIKYVRHGEFLLDKLKHILGENKSTISFKDKNGNISQDEVSNIEFLSGSDDSCRRLAVLEAVKQNKCRILIATSIADEGLDLPILDTLILAGGGKSSTRAYQRVGRVLRIYPGKSKAFVFDFEDETPIFKRHSKVRRKLYEEEEEWDIKTFNVTV